MSEQNGLEAEPAEQRSAFPITRRALLLGAGSMAASALATRQVLTWTEGFRRADVFVARAGSYEANLPQLVRNGLVELGLGRDWVKGKSVLLKPNLVEPSHEAPHINTHPLLVRAVAEVFLRWDAREVFAAEGQGHCRDSELVLEQSGLAPVLADAKVPFVDLNHDDVFEVPNRLGFTRLETLYLPRSLERADIVVSLPKLKTHHWAGATVSMKNLFGMMPGVCYGWPKNVLHQVGIPESIVDITAAVQPDLAIVDGIIGMEGDGPIMGTPKSSGVLLMGRNLPAVDATAARLMDLNPARIPYLAAASGRLGPIAERHIHQRGEPIAPLVQRFALIDQPELLAMRG